MKNVTFSIPNMQSTHCQTRVNNAVKQLEGVQIQKVESGKLTVLLASDNLKAMVENTIIKTGYSVAENEEATTETCKTGCCTK